MMRRNHVTAAIALLLLGLIASGCGNSDADAEALENLPPKLVPVELVPGSLEVTGGSLQVLENTAEETKAACLGGDEKVLTVDCRLWELRAGQRLVGVLQISTTRWKLDLSQERFRNPIVDQVMPSARRTVNVSGVPVVVTESEDKITYLWFGEALFQVLSLKGSLLDTESILEQVIDHQLSTEAGKAIFVEKRAESSPSPGRGSSPSADESPEEDEGFIYEEGL